MSAPFVVSGKRPLCPAGANVARVIPGLSNSANMAARKPPRSVTLDGRYWTAKELDPARPPSLPDALQTCVQMVVPRPWVGSEGLELVTELVADFAAVFCAHATVAFLTAFLVPFGSSRLWRIVSPHMGWLFLYAAVFTLVGHTEGLYRHSGPRNWQQERRLVMKGTVWTTLLLGMAIQLMQSGLDTTLSLLTNAPFALLGMLAWRKWPWFAPTGNAGRESASRRVLIVGGGRLGRKVASHLSRSRGRYFVCGFVDDKAPVTGDLLGRPKDLAQIARAEFVDEVIVALPYRHELAREVVMLAHKNHLDVSIVPDLFGFESAPGLRLHPIDGVPLIALHEERIPAYGLLLKRTVDFLLSATGLLLLSPLLALIVFAIKLDSVGPVLYLAPRIGRKGAKFNCYKFRTMVAHADDEKEKLRNQNERTGPFFKIRNDPRVTKFGRFLRHYSLDELPQLWNVLRGEMSLVGPRPHPLDDFQRYQLDDLRRLDVVPGITGLWQVTARSDPSFQRNMALDLEYIERWSFWMDLRILFKTVSAVLQGSGA